MKEVTAAMPSMRKIRQSPSLKLDTVEKKNPHIIPAAVRCRQVFNQLHRKDPTSCCGKLTNQTEQY